MEEEWEVLSGCNACINSSLCYHLGNCALLTANILFPQNNKTKRDYIKKLRGGITRPDLYAQEMQLKVDRVTKVPEPEKWSNQERHYRTWSGPVRLTVIEKMAITELNRPR